MKDSQNFPLSVQAANLIGAAIIAVAILVSGGVIKPQSATSQAVTAPAASPAAAAPAVPAAVNVSTGNLPVLGNKNAKVTLVEFADFQCPFCDAVTGLDPANKVAQQLKQQDPTWSPYELNIIKDYVNSGKVQFAFRDFSFLGQPQTDPAGDESTNAANAARCANEQGQFWQYHDYLYAHQGQEDGGNFSKDNLKQYAATLGLNATQFNSCVDSDKYVADVKADTAAGKTAGVTGTPSLFINGVRYDGAQGYAPIKAAIDAALAKAG